MKTHPLFLFTLVSAFVALGAPPLLAQGYPKIPHDIQARTDARKAA